jgi:hypothetical protein
MKLFWFFILFWNLLAGFAFAQQPAEQDPENFARNVLSYGACQIGNGLMPNNFLTGLSSSERGKLKAGLAKIMTQPNQDAALKQEAIRCNSLLNKLEPQS